MALCFPDILSLSTYCLCSPTNNRSTWILFLFIPLSITTAPGYQFTTSVCKNCPHLGTVSLRPSTQKSRAWIPYVAIRHPRMTEEDVRDDGSSPMRIFVALRWYMLPIQHCKTNVILNIKTKSLVHPHFPLNLHINSMVSSTIPSLYPNRLASYVLREEKKPWYPNVWKKGRYRSENNDNDLAEKRAERTHNNIPRE